MSGQQGLANRKRDTMIIIGGGIAGLIAARELSGVYQVIVLEAMNRFGGRIHTINEHGFPGPIEAGAEFLHGKAESTLKLLKEAGIGIVSVEGELCQTDDRTQDDAGNPGNTAEGREEESDKQWEELLTQMSVLEQDTTLLEFLNKHFGNEKYNSLQQRAISYAAGFDLADAGKVSVKSLYAEWSQHNEDRVVAGGYGQLIDFLVADCEKRGCELIKNAFVTGVGWGAGFVEVLGQGEMRYRAEKCILTVSAGVLQNGDIKFNPPIARYHEAATKIGFGNVVKILLSFDQQLWKDGVSFFLSDEEVPTWWPQPGNTAAVLTGWAGGERALALTALSDEELVEKALKSLSAIFNLDLMLIRKNLNSSKIFNWSKQNTVRGAYSYATPQSHDALKVLTTPLQDTLYFAGEAIYSGPDPGTVEAAINSAQRLTSQLRLVHEK
ncbi:flavin monoamine oxidase family protein [Pedobacter westerhofensis]|nr:NAD(P)/FAD-dependent oxidoreductase [Pedobacter westerhofensis]